MRLDRVRAMAALEAGVRALRGIERRSGDRGVAGDPPLRTRWASVIGRPEGIENVVFATGHAMKGVHLAPTTASLVADLLTGGEPTTT